MGPPRDRGGRMGPKGILVVGKRLQWGRLVIEAEGLRGTRRTDLLWACFNGAAS